MTAEQPRPERRVPTGAWVAVAVLAVAALVSVPLLSGNATAAQHRPGVAAVIDGTELSVDEVESEAGTELAQVDLQALQCETNAQRSRHEVLNSVTERVVRARLLEIEAEKRGVGTAELEGELADSVSDVSDEDVDEWWAANAEQVNQPREEVEGQIVALLERQKQQKTEESYYQELEERYEVEILLEPFRLAVSSDGHPAWGPDDAPVTIVEFSDFECPYCKRVLPTINKIKDQYPDKVRLVFRQYPLDMHKNARKAAEASLCANDQGEFWNMHDLLFEEQRDLEVDDLKSYADKLELDRGTFDECLDSDRYADQVTRDIREGAIAGVTGTPAMFVNGRLVSGAVPFKTVADLIDDELGRQ